MVWVRVAFHDGNHENDDNDEDNSDSYKQGVECWIRGNHGSHENDENHENPGCKPRVPQTTGLEIPDSESPGDTRKDVGVFSVFEKVANFEPQARPAISAMLLRCGHHEHIL